MSRDREEQFADAATFHGAGLALGVLLLDVGGLSVTAVFVAAFVIVATGQLARARILVIRS